MAVNFPTIGDLQGFARLMYKNLYYQSTGMKFIDEAYLNDVKSTMGGETPVIEIMKQKDTTLNTTRGTVDITTSLTPALATYDNVLVNLTDLKMDYSFQLSTLVTVTNIMGALEGQIKLKEAQIAYETDVYIFGKYVAAITGNENGSEAYTTGQMITWAPSTQQEYIDLLNYLKALLFNRKIYADFRLGLDAIEYGKFVSALTSLLKYETKTGVMGVELGDIAEAYGISIIPVNSTVLSTADVSGNTVGFFANPVAAVGDYFFTAMTEWAGNYPGRPGAYVLEGNVLFGAQIVRPEAAIRLVKSSVISA